MIYIDIDIKTYAFIIPNMNIKYEETTWVYIYMFTNFWQQHYGWLVIWDRRIFISYNNLEQTFKHDAINLIW